MNKQVLKEIDELIEIEEEFDFDSDNYYDEYYEERENR